MIDVESERLIKLSEVATLSWMPAGPLGKPRAYETIRLWHRKGLKGVKLEAVPVGGTLFTSVEAVKRFLEHLAEPRKARTNSDRAKGHERAEAYLKEVGI